MSTTSRLPNWVDVLHHPLGVSLAALVLVPSVGSIAPPAQATQPLNSDVRIVTTMPDGVFDIKECGTYFATEHGLVRAKWMSSQLDKLDSQPAMATDVHSVSVALSRSLLQLSGLKVKTLADAIGVSRATYHKWLKGEGMSDENMSRLNEIQGTLLTLRDIEQDNLTEFLLSETAKEKPLSLLAKGNREALVGMALRRSLKNETVVRRTSIAPRTSGTPGWLRAGRRRSWIPSTMSEDDLYRAAARLNPPSVIESTDYELHFSDDDADTYKVSGYIPE